MVDLLVKNGILLINSELIEANIGIEEGKIATITKNNMLHGEEVIDATGKIVIPGFIDTHVHFREPGYVWKEDFLTGSSAAAAGGVTFFVDMPNTDPPPNTAERFVNHRKMAEAKSIVDFNHWALPTKILEIPKIAEEGAIGFKFFMKVAQYPYGSETSIVDTAQILDVFKAIAKTGLPVLVHPYDQLVFEANMRKYSERGDTSGPEAFVRLEAEDNCLIKTSADVRLCLLAEISGAKLRILHVDETDHIRLARRLRAAGFKFLAEMNPWAIFPWPTSPAGPGVPGLRHNHELIMGGDEQWQALNDGFIDVMATDHAPHTLDESKEAAKNVFTSVILGYPLVEHYMAMFLTEVNRNRISLARLCQLCSENPAKQNGLYPMKGSIRVGSDADLVLIDMKEERVLAKDYPVHSKIGWSPYEGMKVKGIPICTIVRGKVVMQNQKIVGKPGYGRFVAPQAII